MALTQSSEADVLEQVGKLYDSWLGGGLGSEDVLFQLGDLLVQPTGAHPQLDGGRAAEPVAGGAHQGLATGHEFADVFAGVLL
jgi:hypothetical protein